MCVLTSNISAKLEAQQASTLSGPDPTSVKLDNQLNWFFSSPKELCATIRYQRDGKQRDLVFIKPEGYETYLKMMAVSAEAKRLGIKNHADQSHRILHGSTIRFDTWAYHAGR